MLNELVDLSRSLKLCGVSAKEWHQFYQQLPKSSKMSRVLWVFLSESAGCTGVDYFPLGDASAQYRKWQPAKGNAFPAFKIHTLSCLPPSANEQFKELKQSLGKPTSDWTSLKVRISEFLAKASPTWGAISSRTEKNLHKISLQVEEILSRQAIPEEYRAIAILIQRSRSISIESFFSSLLSALSEKVLSSPKAAIEYLPLLLYCKEEDPKKEGGTDFQVLLELADWNQIECAYPANHPKVQEFINSCLMVQRDIPGANNQGESDAYGGQADGFDSSFPQARIPVLGNVTLRAMAAEIPSQKRYGMIEGASFKVGKKIRDECNAAVQWLASPERIGKTWQAINISASGQALLLAYPSAKPDFSPDIACLLCGDMGTEAPFEAVAEQVISSLRGILKEHSDTSVHVFVLGKPDGHRTKVLVSDVWQAARLVAAVERWQQAARALPPITIRTFADGKPQDSKPLIPSPAEVAWCLNTCWMRASGKDKAKRPLHATLAHGFSVQDALSLFISPDQPMKTSIERARHAAQERASPLLAEIGHWAALGKVLPIEKAFSKQALLWPSILGILLDDLNPSKGGCMENFASLIGRILNLTDQLHYQYCLKVRDGSVPPQLAGNALLSVAMAQPEKALTLYWDRVKPYQAWARSLHGSSDTGLIKYFLSEMGDICVQLKELEIPQLCNDAHKVQMLLGYLAKSQKRDAPELPSDKS